MVTRRKTSQQFNLSLAERQVLQALTTGEFVDLTVGDPEHDDPAGGGTWNAKRAINAALLVDLITSTRQVDAPERAIKVRGARILGAVNLETARLVRPLHLRDCYFDEPVNLNEAAAPAIRLPGCHLPALSADQLRTIGNLDLTNGFTARGEVRLDGARIGGHLRLSGASLINPGGHALFADLVLVEQSMLCRYGFTAQGTIRLRGARIGGQFNLNGASLSNPGGHALWADRLEVKHGIFFRDGFIARGEVNLAASRIGAQLDLSGASLINPGGRALYANRITVDHSIFCEDGFSAQGEIRLSGASIAGVLSFRGSVLENPGGTALDLEASNAAALYLLPENPPEGVVALTNAKVGDFFDEPASWPKKLDLRGFAYMALVNRKVSVHERLRWLTLHPGRYTPQLYDQLAAVYKSTGYEEAARRVGIAKQWRRRAVLNPAGKLLNWLLYLTVGYGYRTWLAGVWLAGLLALGTWVFSRAYPGQMAAASAHPPAFHSFAYAVDVR
jgi:hypothetical protein